MKRIYQGNFISGTNANSAARSVGLDYLNDINGYAKKLHLAVTQFHGLRPDAPEIQYHGRLRQVQNKLLALETHPQFKEDRYPKLVAAARQTLESTQQLSD